MCGKLRQKGLVNSLGTMPDRGQDRQDRGHGKRRAQDRLVPLDEPDLQENEHDAEQERHQEIGAENVRLGSSAFAGDASTSRGVPTGP